MDDFDSTVAATAEAEFDGRWGIWLSDTGQWWAARRQALSAEELAAGCVPHFQADSPDELRDRIRDEEALTMHHKAHQERQQISKETDRLWKSRVNGLSRSPLC
jgi:hypothetical protein